MKKGKPSCNQQEPDEQEGLLLKSVFHSLFRSDRFHFFLVVWYRINPPASSRPIPVKPTALAFSLLLVCSTRKFLLSATISLIFVFVHYLCISAEQRHPSVSMYNLRGSYG